MMTPLDQAVAAVRAALPSDAMPVADPLTLAVERVLVMMEWQPIATAPKDGRTILVGAYENDNWEMEMVDADEYEFSGDGWGITRNICGFTHWMHLFNPPTLSQQEGAKG